MQSHLTRLQNVDHPWPQINYYKKDWMSTNHLNITIANSVSKSVFVKLHVLWYIVLANQWNGNDMFVGQTKENEDRLFTGTVRCVLRWYICGPNWRKWKRWDSGGQIMYWYSEICLLRPLQWETTFHIRPLEQEHGLTFLYICTFNKRSPVI